MSEWFFWICDHLTGEFGLGFVIGSFIMAFWDNFAAAAQAAFGRKRS